jgi:hypothetical protein
MGASLPSETALRESVPAWLLLRFRYCNSPHKTPIHALFFVLSSCFKVIVGVVLLQGLEIVNPQAAEKKVAEANQKYFSNTSEFVKVKKE